MTDLKKCIEQALEQSGAQKIYDICPQVSAYQIQNKGGIIGNYTGNIRLPDKEYGILEGAALLVYLGLEREIEESVIATITVALHGGEHSISA